jgi:hypothetical protein
LKISPCRVIAATLGAAVLLLSPSCGILSGGRSDPTAPAASDCPPLKVDAATASIWAEALHTFISGQQIEQACILIKRADCLQDPPATVLDRLRDREERLASWPFACGAGVTVLTLRDEQGSEGRSITVSDGFKVTCRFGTRRTWLPGQSRVKLEGCGPARGAGAANP